MKILKTESFSRIVPLLRENYGNLHARLALKLPPQTARMFARFTLQSSQGGAQWTVNMDCENSLRPYSAANPLERDQISMVLKQAQADVRKSFGMQGEMMEKLLNVPEQDCIFFAPARSGKLPVVVLTEWGFRRVQAAAGENVLKLCLERAAAMSDAPVEIYVGYSDGSPAADRDFRLCIFGNEIPFTTDSAGLYSPGHLVTGKEFEVRSADGSVSAPFVVEQGKTRYDVIMTKTTALTVRVLQSDGATPVPGVEAMADGATALTDDKGEAHFGPYAYDGPRQLTVSADGVMPVSHTLSADPEANIVVLTMPEPEPEVEAPPAPETPEVVIRILDRKGVPMAGMPVKILCKKGYEETVTDASGRVTLKASDLIPGEKPKIVLSRPEGESPDKPLNRP